MILNIGKRKLQYLRNSRKIPYSMINGKIFYKPEDVRRLITDVVVGG
ncbi:helix-turn-helix domain-containing protein [Parabacteroides sp. AF48-14]